MKPYDIMTHVLIEKAAGDAYEKATQYPAGENAYTTLIRSGDEVWEIRVSLESGRHQAMRIADRAHPPYPLSDSQYP